MAANAKYKVANMAKDIDKKTKDIVEVLKNKGFDGKTSSSVLENNEINIVLEYYTSASTVEDIQKYLSSAKPEVKPVKTEKAEEVKEEKPAKKEPQKQEVSVAEKIAVETPKTEKVHVENTAKAAPAQRPQGRQNNFEGSAEQNQQGAFRNGKKPFEKRPGDAQRKPFNNGDRPERPQFGQRQQLGQTQLTDRQIEKQISKIQREGAQLLKQEGIKPERMEAYPKFDRNERFDKYSNVKFTKDGFVSEAAPQNNQQKFQKPKFQKGSQGQFGRNNNKDEDSQSVRQPSLKPVFDKDGRIKSRYAGERKEGIAPAADDDGRVRIDMRSGGEVDLSKYD